MRGVLFFRSAIPLYFALILILPCSETLHSMIHLWFRYDCEQVQMSAMPLTFAAQLQENLDDSRLKNIDTQVSQIDGIAEVEHFLPIPTWRGEPELQESWKTMWEAYVSPVLYATTAIQIQWHDQAQELADQISQVSGVERVSWDDEAHLARVQTLKQTRDFQTFINIIFFFFLVVVVGGLVVNYPVSLRRKYIKRTGLYGIGLTVKSETFWLILMAYHGGLAILVYFVTFSLGYLFFPFPLQVDGSPTYAVLLMKGGFVVGGLAAAVCLIGWWLDTRELDIVAGLPMADWEE